MGDGGKSWGVGERWGNWGRSVIQLTIKIYLKIKIQWELYFLTFMFLDLPSSEGSSLTPCFIS